jgi:predicted esterase YcpF (UPF0227 family)
MSTLPLPVTKILYLHGFRSSPLSTKAQLLERHVREHFPQVHWWCPQLPPSPRAAMEMVTQGVSGWPAATTGVIGSSLGGFYAAQVAQMLGCRGVLLNPAVHPARDLAGAVGEQALWHRPEDRFDFEPGFVAELKALENGPLKYPENFFAVIAKGDEVLDWREMTNFCRGARIKLLEGGDHGLADFGNHIGEVFAFLGLG